MRLGNHLVSPFVLSLFLLPIDDFSYWGWWLKLFMRILCLSFPFSTLRKSKYKNKYLHQINGMDEASQQSSISVGNSISQFSSRITG